MQRLGELRCMHSCFPPSKVATKDGAPLTADVNAWQTPVHSARRVRSEKARRRWPVCRRRPAAAAAPLCAAQRGRAPPVRRGQFCAPLNPSLGDGRRRRQRFGELRGARGRRLLRQRQPVQLRERGRRAEQRIELQRLLLLRRGRHSLAECKVVLTNVALVHARVTTHEQQQARLGPRPAARPASTGPCSSAAGSSWTIHGR